jgi:hypothetical protein
MSVPAARVKVGTEFPDQCGLCAKPTAHKTSHAATALASTTLATTTTTSPDATASLIAKPANVPAVACFNTYTYTSAAVVGAPWISPLKAGGGYFAVLMTVITILVIKMPRLAAEALESESGAHSASQPLTAADDAQPGSATTPYVPL